MKNKISLTVQVSEPSLLPSADVIADWALSEYRKTRIRAEEGSGAPLKVQVEFPMEED